MTGREVTQDARVRTSAHTTFRICLSLAGPAGSQRTQDVAPLIAEARKAGHTSTRAIAAYLNGRKSTTPRGKQWTPTAVAAAMTFSQHFDAD
jgi:hypothetical protein